MSDATVGSILAGNITGYCPACGRESLIRSPMGAIMCLGSSCPDMFAVHKRLSRPPEKGVPHE